jgi:hypothetical protein
VYVRETGEINQSVYNLCEIAIQTCHEIVSGLGLGAGRIDVADARDAVMCHVSARRAIAAKAGR